MEKVEASEIFYKRMKKLVEKEDELKLAKERLEIKITKLKVRTIQFWHDFEKQYGVRAYKFNKEKGIFLRIEEGETFHQDNLPIIGLEANGKKKKKET